MSFIVILSPAHPLRGGIASSSERLAQELQTQGHKVKIVSFSLQYPSFLFPGKTQFTDDPAPADLDIETRLNSVSPINWINTGNYLKKLGADLIIVRYWLPFMGPSLGTCLRIAKSNKKTKVMALADNIIPHEKRPGDVLFTKYFSGSVDGFITMSRSVAEETKQFAKGKPIVYTPHPIYDNYGDICSREEAIQQLKLDTTFNYILFFGFIRDYKGLDLLLEAFAQVDNENLKLIVAGEFYGNKEKYFDLVDSLHIKDKVIFHSDFIPNEKVKYYFGAADLVAQPYRTATQSGISQLAYHFEKPMLVTHVGGLPEIVEHGKVGYVVPVDVAAIQTAISDFYSSPSKKEIFEQGVKENKKLFGWDKMVDAINDCWAQF